PPGFTLAHSRSRAVQTERRVVTDRSACSPIPAPQRGRIRTQGLVLHRVRLEGHGTVNRTINAQRRHLLLLSRHSKPVMRTESAREGRRLPKIAQLRVTAFAGARSALGTRPRMKAGDPHVTTACLCERGSQREMRQVRIDGCPARRTTKLTALG